MVGKVVVTRGHASGVNLGLCGDIGSSWILLLSPVYYMKHWTWDKSNGCFGSFHSLAYGNVTGGVGIEKFDQDLSIHAIQQVVECTPDVLTKVDKFSIPPQKE
jgi:hypothetical protein